jgi:hypothetical protein
MMVTDREWDLLTDEEKLNSAYIELRMDIKAAFNEVGEISKDHNLWVVGLKKSTTRMIYDILSDEGYVEFREYRRDMFSVHLTDLGVEYARFLFL